MKYTLATLPFVANVATAHSGHDHGAWNAPLLHALWMAPIAMAAIAATYFVVKKIKK